MIETVLRAALVVALSVGFWLVPRAAPPAEAGPGGVIYDAGAASPRSPAALQAVSICVEVPAPSPPTIDSGPLLPGATAVSPQLAVQNCGSVVETFLIQGSNAIAAVSGQSNWTLSSTSGSASMYTRLGSPAAGLSLG